MTQQETAEWQMGLIPRPPHPAHFRGCSQNKWESEYPVPLLDDLFMDLKVLIFL